MDVTPDVSLLFSSLMGSTTAAAAATKDDEPATSTRNGVVPPKTVNQVQKSTNRSPACEWTSGETKLMLDYYEQYFPQVGPMKKFKNKKHMFARIAANICEALGVQRTGDQCCRRYKTIIKRKRTALVHNSTSGNSPSEVPYEDELSKIRWADDSIEPEQLRDSYGIVSQKTCPGAASPQASPVPDEVASTEGGRTTPNDSGVSSDASSTSQ
ncbi:uncharacterized protein LOC135393163 [Ornithodoros turicata]|uniref:uncharacterized protein LOC135393163 n=1 Tax=Ornithodoros turicata TaxID=34597 RepID=UPI0031398C49